MTVDGPSPSASQTSVLAAAGISKSFGPVPVLFDVDLALAPGEVHALVGENGAGKSTLMKILAGYLQPSSGRILFDGEAVVIPDSAAGERLGVVMIHQEFNLAEHLTVEENIFLGRELRRGWLLDKRAMRRRSREALIELESRVDPDRRIHTLSVSEKQMVEIAKAVSRETRVLLMDEPTAALTGAETAVLFRLIRRLRAQGVTVVYTSHKLDEVKEIADRVTVLRDGRVVATRPNPELTQDDMARLMVGRDMADMYPPKARPPEAEVVLRVERVSVPGWVADASFELRRGEILGFAGLVGAGRTELMEAVVGLRPTSGGTVYRRGRPVAIRSPKDAAAAGIAYLTEDRKGRGLLLNMRLRPNLTLLALDRFSSGLLIDERAEERALERAIEGFDIRVARRDAIAGTLSGGNQQKLLLAKTMEVAPEVVIIDEPTRGIDIGTKQQIYRFVHGLAAGGTSCVVVSSEMQELIGLCHRVLVMRSGRIVGELVGDAIEEHEIVRYATGLKGTDGRALVDA